MPGFVESTVNAGYGYVDPYIQKGRDKVPLFDRAAQKVEYHAPALISKVDQLAEPTIQKVKPRVEPIYHKGKQQAGALKGHVEAHYERGVKHVHKAKAVKDKHVGMLSQIFIGAVTKLESLMDKYLPADTVGSQSKSDDSTSSDKSALLPRVTALPFTLVDRLVCRAKGCIPAFEDLPFVKSYLKLKAKLTAKVAPIQLQATEYVNQKLQYLEQTCQLQNYVVAVGKVAAWANAGCERALGKERVQASLAKIEVLIPASWRAALSKLTEPSKAA